MSNLASARRIAWTIWSVNAGLVAVSLGLAWLNRRTFLPSDAGPALINASSVLVYGTVGAIIVARQPRHAIGRLFCLLALPTALQIVFQEYAVLGYLVVGAPWPGLRLAAWLQAWIGYLSFPVPLALPYLLFPTGRLPSARWRWLVGVIVLVSLMNLLTTLTVPGRLIVYRGDQSVSLPVINPTGLPARLPALQAFLELSWPLALLAYLASILAGLVRFNRARGDERQQLKWFAYFGSLTLLLTLLSAFLQLIPNGRLNAWVELLGDLPLVIVVLSTPVAAGIAILRYRLYDIDRLINRTLTYALLSGALSLVYFGSVALLQQVFAGQSPLVIVASTLLIAVLFAPMRSRFQAVIDQRFHRRRYDAQRILHAFSATTRSEVNLDRLSRDLETVVQQSVEPATVSLWLRDQGTSHPNT